MRRLGPLFAILSALSLLTGCTSTQVKEASGQVAGGLMIMALDVALGGPERRLEERKRREAVPGYEWNPCLRACELARETAADIRLDQVEARKRRAESEAFQADFDAFMQALEEAEEQTSDPPSLSMSRE